MFQDQSLVRNKSSNSRQFKQNKRIILRNIIADRTLRHQNQIQNFIKKSNKNTENLTNLRSFEEPIIKQFQCVEIIKEKKDQNFTSNVKLSNNQVIHDQVQELKKYCEYLKKENIKLKDQVNKLSITKDRSDEFIQTTNLIWCEQSTQTQIDNQRQIPLKQKHQYNSMTHLTLTAIEQLQNTVHQSIQYTNKLVKQIECSYSNLDELNIEFQYSQRKVQKYQDQITKKIEQIQLLQMQLDQIRKTLFEKPKSVSVGWSMTNTVAISTLQQRQKQKQDFRRLKKENTYFKALIQDIICFIEQKSIQTLNRDHLIQEDILLSKCEIIEKIKTKIQCQNQLSAKPMQEEIILMKEILASQKRKYENQQLKLHKLLSDAHHTIEQLMHQLRNTKKQAKDHFIQNLKIQRSFIGLKQPVQN